MRFNYEVQAQTFLQRWLFINPQTLIQSLSFFSFFCGALCVWMASNIPQILFILLAHFKNHSFFVAAKAIPEVFDFLQCFLI